jgi:predicted phage tail protein
MAEKSVTSRDQQIAATNTMLSKTIGLSREQTISITDLISEGPIEGLVNGEASIFLNDDRIVPLENTAVSNLSNSSTIAPSISLTFGSTSATLIGAVPTSNLGVRNFRLKEVFSSSINVGSIVPSQIDSNISALSISTATAFFTTDMAFNSGVPSTYFGYFNDLVKLVIEETGTIIVGFLSYVNSTNAIFSSKVEDPILLDIFKEESVGNTVKIIIDGVLQSISSTTNAITLLEASTIPTGTYEIIIGSRIFDDLVSQGIKNSSGITHQFRNGNANQEPMIDFGGTGSVSIVSTTFSSQTLINKDGQSDPSIDPPESPTLILKGSASTATGFGLTPAQAKEVDEVRLLISYSSFYTVQTESGDESTGAASYKIELTLYRGLSTSTVTIAENKIHTASSTGPVTFEEVINLEPFKPFSDFDVRVTRLTRSTGLAVNLDLTDTIDSKWQQYSESSITSITSIIKEKLSYPFSAYANVTFSSKDYQNVPTRTYHLRGMKIKLPSNYTTREKNDGLNSIYTGLWDGSFKTELEYSNNPAWVFYDIITNNRYGLGDWVDATEIDKFYLYRIAKYCDELVSNGKGGLEPRFTANLYLTKATDAYKVLKDMATTFLGMLYWMDAQIVAVNDAPKDPIYLFTKGNVIEGSFNYESTGSKTRANQIVVNWNNPESNYALEPIIVEDSINIAETGRIVSESAMAFGCTSEGQAYRYGKWKLWTSVNQTEIISFKTSIDSAFLMPGDVISIQDADRYGVQYSGRISSTGTLSLSQIPLDRSILLNSGSTYTLSVVIENAIVDEENEAPSETVVESRTVTTGAGSVTSLTVSTAFSLLPPIGSIWVLKETNSLGQVVSSSTKDYKILSISEDDANTYSLSCVEYYDEKYSAIEGDFTLVLEDTVYPPLKATDIVPAPPAIYILRTPDYTKGGDEFIVSWDAPLNTDNTPYDNISGYELVHNIPDYENPISLTSSIKSYLFENVSDDNYYAGVRTVSTIDNKSEFTTTEFEIEDYFYAKVPRQAAGLAVGGTSSNPLVYASSSYNIQFASTNTDVYPIQNSNTKITVASSSFNTVNTSIPDGDYFAMLDASESTIIPVKYNAPKGSKAQYWYNVIDAAGTPDNTFIQQTGTITIAANSNKVIGSSTSFLSDYAVGDIIKTDSTLAAKVVHIASNTLLLIDRSLNASYSGNHFRQGLRIDFLLDTIVAKITKTGSTSTFNSYLSVSGATVGAQFGVDVQDFTGVVLTPESNFGVLVTSLDTFTVVDTEILDADSVIAREVQVFPEGGTAPTINGTTLTGAGIDLKADGDLYVGNFSTDKYIFWDQSAGVLTLRGDIDAGDISAGFISADRIQTGSLNAEVITAGTITADEIATGAITADKVLAGAITAVAIDVENLSSLSANLGAVTAGTIRGGTIPEANTSPSVGESGAFLDLSGGKMIFGNTDKYVWWDGTNLQINGVTISNSALEGSSGFATEAYVNASVAALIDGAPGALDTLNELAAAIGDNADYAASIVTALAGKVGTTSPQALSADANAMTISGHTITLARADGTSDTIIVPDNDTTYSAGSGITLTGTTFSNASPDQTVTLTGSGATTISGAYPNFTISSTDNDTIYTLPAATTTVRGGIELEDATVQTVVANTVSATAGRTYGLQVNSAGQGVINVPWVNTTYSVGNGGLTEINFSSTLNNKLAGIADNANNYVLPFVDNSGNWNAAYGWGNHATQGYLVSTDTIDDANSLGGIAASGYVQTTSAQALHLTDALRVSGTTVSLYKGDGSSESINTQDTTYSAGSGITLTGTTFSNASPDQTVTLTGSGATTISGAYPNFTISSTDNDTIYTLPAATTTVRGGIELEDATVQTVVANTVSDTAGRTYGLQVNSAGQGVINVPWVDNNTVYTHPAYTTRSITTSGASVLSTFTSDAIGSVTGITTRTMTLADLGYTGATNANYITNNNQLINGAGYVTVNTTYSLEVPVGTTSIGLIGNPASTDSIALAAGTGITLARTDASTITITGTAQYTPPAYVARSIDTVGAEVIDVFTSNTLGHVTNATKRTMTLADLGYTGATNANYITNNNQLINGAGYTTNIGDITEVIAGNGLTGGGASGSVTLNIGAGTGITVSADSIAVTNWSTKMDTITADVGNFTTVNTVFLNADTIVADQITANTLTLNKLQTAAVAGEGQVQIGTAGIRILDSSGILRVAIGNLTVLATTKDV